MAEASNSENVLTQRQRIAELARQSSQMGFTSLNHLLDLPLLYESFGFRPGRSAHQALAALWQQTMGIRGGWILEVDIRKFFDNLDHTHLRR
jgi:hypothetical protein